MRLVTLLFLASTPGLAQSWSGYLVDSTCYSIARSNGNKDATTTDRDMNIDLRQCSPDAKTKVFAVVLPDWNSLNFDTGGNAKAAEIFKNAGKRSVTEVTVTGERTKDNLKVESLAKVTR